MYFSDKLYLVAENRYQDVLKIWRTKRTETGVWADLTSISSKEKANAGQDGHQVSARATLHIEDYSGQSIVRNPTASIYLKDGYFDVYRTYVKGDTVELYLEEREGIDNE